MRSRRNSSPTSDLNDPTIQPSRQPQLNHFQLKNPTNLVEMKQRVVSDERIHHPEVADY